MLVKEAIEAQHLLDTAAIRFYRAKDGYFIPYTLTDRNAIKLCYVEYVPTRNYDYLLSQFADIAWVELIERPGHPIFVED